MLKTWTPQVIVSDVSRSESTNLAKWQSN